VRAVTLHALAGAVHADLGELALLLRVAAGTIRGPRFAMNRVRRGVRRGNAFGERVTSGAVRRDIAAKARARLLGSVLQTRLLFVTNRTFLRVNDAHRGARELVTLGARDPVFLDVLLVAAHAARGLPDCLDVHATPRGARAMCRFGLRASSHDRGERYYAGEHDRRNLCVACVAWLHHARRPRALPVLTRELTIERALPAALCCAACT
jgi:hypothetical protein